MLSIADKNQMHFNHDSYPAIAPKYSYIKVSSKIMLNLFQIQINVHVISKLILLEISWVNKETRKYTQFAKLGGLIPG